MSRAAALVAHELAEDKVHRGGADLREVRVDAGSAERGLIGGGIGTLTLNGGSTSGALLTMNNGSSFSFNLGASNTSDRLRFFNYAGASDFVRNGTVTLNFLGAQTGTFTLFQFFSDAGTTIAASAINSGLTLGTGLEGFSSTLNYNANDITLTVAAIPEPSAFAAFAGLGALGLAALRRRRRS